MGDVLGAAAGYGMICLILMLIASFLTEIQKLKQEKLHETGRVFLYCGLFGAAHYGALALIRMALYGAENLNGFGDLVSHPAFTWRYDLPDSGAMYAITLSWVIMAVAGCFLFYGVRAIADPDGAAKGLMLFYLLPGMGWAFMPGFWCLIALAAAVVIFVFMKTVRPLAVVKMPGWLYGGICVLFAMVRGFMLFLFVKGV